jgi:hypothetical protein
MAGQVHFPIERNNVKALPIRFEYQLMDKDTLKIGNVDLDTQLLQLTMVSGDSSEGPQKLRFQWPAGLLTDGSFHIRDSSGKSIWTETIQPSEVMIEDQSGKKVGRFETGNRLAELMIELRKIPFFKFCLTKEEDQARSYICSKDLYIKPKSKPLQIAFRDSFRQDSYIEINGQIVEPQGVIVLNNKKDFLSMRALLLSGATFEIESKQPNFEFVDFSINEKNQKYLISVKGALPVENTPATRISADVWQMEVDLERPSVYLLGPAGIPLRQEFLIKGPVKKSNLTIEADQAQYFSTYRRSALLQLKASLPVKIAALDASSEVQPTEENGFEWILGGLEAGKANRKWIKVSHDNSAFYGSFDVLKERSIVYQFRATYPLGLEASADWLFSEKTHIHVDYKKIFQRSENERDPSALSLGFFYRDQHPFLRESGFNFGGELSSFTLDDKSGVVASLALGFDRILDWDFFAKDPQSSYLFTSKLSYPAWSAAGELKNQSSYLARLGLRKFKNPRGFFEVGLDLWNLSFSDKESIDFNYKKTMIYASIGIFSK